MSDILDILPKPKIVEEIPFQQILDFKMGVFLTDYKNNIGKDYTALTESSVVVRLIRSSAEEEFNARQRANERYRNRLVYFATIENLDILLREEGLEPVDGESKERKQDRIILQRVGSSAAGPPEWYKRKAYEVAPDEIENISVDFPESSTVRISILANTEDGIPSEDLLARIRTELTSQSVHPDDHTVIIVAGAEPVNIRVHARIVLEPDTDSAVFDALESHFRSAFAGRRGLGRDVPWSWISSRLQVAGVYCVENLGDEPFAILPHQVAKLESIFLDKSAARAY
jgi:phage-related baseplate assembly protein